MKVGDRVRVGWHGVMGVVESIVDNRASVRGFDGVIYKNQPVSTLRPIAAPAVSPELVERMVQLVRDVADRIHAHQLGEEARAILVELEPVDPLVLRARELLVAECEAGGEPGAANLIGKGERDGTPAMRAVVRALRGGA